MKKNTLFLGALALAMLAGLALSGCEVTTLESGRGIIKLTNNSTNVLIAYWSVESASGKLIWEKRLTLYPGYSSSLEMGTATGISVYVEDTDGDAYKSKKSYTVKKDETVEVKFPGDFSPEY